MEQLVVITTAVLGFCYNGDMDIDSEMKTVTDQMGRTLMVPVRPQRIISLVPSQTELLIDLGAAVVGRTKFCVHPAEQVAAIDTVGGTKRFRFDEIDRLQPDLIIGNKEENYQEGIERLAVDYPVWMSDVRTLPQAMAMMRQVGGLVGRETAAAELVTAIEKEMGQVGKAARPWRVGYFIWEKPPMVVGADTFIDDMLGRCGWVNGFADLDGRYPVVTAEQIAAADLDVILLSSEPFPYTRQHATAYEVAYGVPAVCVDGEMFSWYGNRLQKAGRYLQRLQAQLAERV